MKMMIADKKKQWLDLLKYKPVAFGIEAGFTDLVDIHNEWIKSFLYADDDQTLQAHRGSFKTTCLSVAIALMLVIYPTQNIIMFRKADDDVKEIISQVATLLKTEIFQSLSQALYDTPIILIKESAFEIDTNLKATTRGSSQLLGIGSKGSITGKHADIVITDDIINMNDRISLAERKRTKLIYQELQNIKNRTGRFINTGTPWHKDDAFELMPNVKRHDIHSTGLADDTEVQNLRDSMTASLFAANYELKHIADEEALFTNAVIDDGSNTEKIFNGVCHTDAAYGGDDYTAFTVMKRDKETDTIYAYGKMWHKHVDDVLPTIEQLRSHYKAGTHYSEDNADKGYLEKKVQRPRKGYHESMNKYVKISTYLRENWSRIVWIKDTDLEYVNQILDYTENADHDDAPDSAASLLKEALSKKGSGWLY